MHRRKATSVRAEVFGSAILLAACAGLACGGSTALTSSTPTEAPSVLAKAEATETTPEPAVHPCVASPAAPPAAFTVITTSRPWCARWIDQWDNETGFLLELRYLGATPDRRGGETFEYRLPPNVTEHAIPEADMPGAAGTSACLPRNDAEFRLYVELPAGRLEASSASLLGLCR